ncbi:hypothetical protein [Actinoallomurus sp. NPDC052274]|uniref:hypothetical protein n=1 Tax=Actinoallomurus sp. NPDC052274 TaxID=3155420 RepID=UPI00341FF0A2
MTWYATVLPLGGVVLGSAGTLFGQYLSTRVDARRERRAQVTAERAERKEAILGFLSAAQSVELYLDRRDTAGSREDDGEAGDRLHALWLAKKTCELVCSDGAAQAAHDYTLVLHDLVRARPKGPAGKRELRHAFMEEARSELGIEGRPLRRELPPPT